MDEGINLAKITGNVFKESSSVSIAKSIIEKNKCYKCYFSENDKTPNLDGSILILEDGTIQSTVEVQIKTLPQKYMGKQRYFYNCDTKTFNVVLKKVTRNPVALLMVDINKELVFYKIITMAYAQSLNIDCNKTKRISFTDADLFDNNKFKINTAMDDMGKRLVTSLAQKAAENFVYSYFYTDALAILNKDNAIMISGYSGVGKSDLSVLLADNFSETHDIIFKQDLNLQTLHLISGSFKKEPEKQEVILLDDFLGQNELGYEDYISELYTFIKYLLKLPSKKIILNTRGGIFKSLHAHNSNFYEMLHNEIKEVKINYTDADDKYKLEIIVKYIRYWNLPKEYISELTSDMKKLNDILQSPYFTPLMVKYATNPQFITPKIFVDTFIEQLNKPDTIWEKEYNCLNKNAKIYLHTLFSLTDTMIKKTVVDECYAHRIISDNETFDDESTENTFSRLEGTLIICINGKIKVCHPSLNQYLFKRIGLAERKKIAEFAIYISNNLNDLMISSLRI